MQDEFVFKQISAFRILMGSNGTLTLAKILRTGVQARSNLSVYRFLSVRKLNERGDFYYAPISYDFDSGALYIKPYRDISDLQGEEPMQVELSLHLDDKVAVIKAEIG